MLQRDEFVNLDKGIENSLETINELVDRQGGKFDRVSRKKTKRTSYLDTANYELNRNNFFLRIKKEPNEYDITLKCRHPDRYISASYDLSRPNLSNYNSSYSRDTPKLRFKKYKFEEDITTPYNSKFSSQAKFENDHFPVFRAFEDLLSIYPDLQRLGISPDKQIRVVNDFEVIEIAVELGNIKFKGGEVKSEMALWYNEKQDWDIPVIVELDFDIESKNLDDGGSKTLLEEFPLHITENIYELYRAIQSKEIADVSSPKTKTELAYGT